MRSAWRSAMPTAAPRSARWAALRRRSPKRACACGADGWSAETQSPAASAARRSSPALHSLFIFANFPNMIGRIAGSLLEKNPPHLLVDCNGVGYEIDVPMSTFYNLPSTGERVVLFTQMIVREDAHLLFGFGTAEERAT